MENLEQIDKIMRNFVAELGYDEATSMFADINSGKKLRSKLILNIAGASEPSIRLCAVVELIHAASLLHDDVIDDSELRRGKPAINALYGAKNAIMLGDILYSKGFFELSKFDDFVAMSISNAVSRLSIGELMDVKLGENFNANLDAYFKMIYYKTAVLIEASSESAAYLAKMDSQKFGEYGKNLGIAFQIVDDILDITQDEKTLGKPAMNDYREGKTTLPYIYLYRVLDKNGKEKLKSLYKKELTGDEISWLKAQFGEYNIISRCVNEAKDYVKKAILAISEYKNEALENVAKKMIDREF